MNEKRGQMPEKTDSELLARIDERTDNMLGQIRSMLAKMETFATTDEIEAVQEQAKGFVTKDEFAPVKAIVFGAVALVLLAFMGTLIYLAGFQHPSP